MESRNKLTMCRLCLCENECLINIFKPNELQGYVAAEVICDLLQFQVSETDAYPHVVCTTCLTKLTDFKIFKKCCQNSMVIYDDMFVSCESLAEHQPEMEKLNESEAFEDAFEAASTSVDNFGQESGRDLESGERDPLEDTSSDEKLIESEEFEAASMSEDNFRQESGRDGSDLELGERDPLEDTSSDEERENKAAPEKGVGRSKGSFECYHCKKALSTKGSLRRHMSVHGYGKPHNRKEEKFECHHCTKVLRSRSGLKGHLATHGIGKFFNCKVCGKICVCKSVLETHLRTHVGERTYSCSNCSKIFICCDSLNVVTQADRKGNVFKCKECISSVSQSDNPKSHARLPSELKPYLCEVCHATFRDKFGLMSHMKFHDEKRPQKCIICAKAFILSPKLRRRIVLSGDRTYSCTQCSKQIRSRENLSSP